MGYGKPSSGTVALMRRRPAEADPAGAHYFGAGGARSVGGDRVSGRRRSLPNLDRREGRGRTHHGDRLRSRYGQADIEGLADHDRSDRL